MFSYKQRYKPRTEREYTKTDLTVYDSAGNTALNTLKVYGKSEIVDGAIKSAGDSGSIEIETCGKNLFDPSKLVTENITYTDGVLSGAASSFNDTYRYGIPILFTKTRQITFSAKIYTNGANPNGDGLRVLFVYKDGTSNALYVSNNTTQPQAFTLTSNATKQMQYIGITYGSEGANIWYLSEIQLEYGSTVTAYEPYNGTMATFSTGTPLRGITGGARDVMTWDGSSGEVTKNCVEVDLGTLTWTKRTADVEAPYFYASLSDIYKFVSSNSNTLCANYNQQNIGTTGTATGYFITNTNQIRIRDNNYADAAAFKTAMSGVMLIYELATPTTEQLTQTENESIASLRTFDGTTHFTNNASTDMTVNYTIKVPTIS